MKVRLLYGNERTYTAKVTRDMNKALGLKALLHPLCLSDIDPSDLFLLLITTLSETTVTKLTRSQAGFNTIHRLKKGGNFFFKREFIIFQMKIQFQNFITLKLQIFINFYIFSKFYIPKLAQSKLLCILQKNEQICIL